MAIISLKLSLRDMDVRQILFRDRIIFIVLTVYKMAIISILNLIFCILITQDEGSFVSG